ncbi:MAG: TIGR02996 domain-containing protein [Fimbriiglobus sp.]|jgi:uncharacterized protein (TIGR02996 family)|nr:TIGR02996 domain-containing protein [Fimbriiglobus sp.]
MTTADALLAAVCAAPDDDLPRLVYADWCEENADPERAEFIRLQVGQANGAATEAGLIREKVLHDAHAERWLAPLRQAGGPLANGRSHAAFRRGFVEVVWMPAVWLERQAERLFALAPVVELRLLFDELSELVRLLENCESLARLKVLDVCDRRFGGIGLMAVGQSPHLTHLTALRLRQCNIDDQAAELLPLRRYDLLDLRDNPLSAAVRNRLREHFGPAVLLD